MPMFVCNRAKIGLKSAKQIDQLPFCFFSFKSLEILLTCLQSCCFFYLFGPYTREQDTKILLMTPSCPNFFPLAK